MSGTRGRAGRGRTAREPDRSPSASPAVAPRGDEDHAAVDGSPQDDSGAAPEALSEEMLSAITLAVRAAMRDTPPAGSSPELEERLNKMEAQQAALAVRSAMRDAPPAGASPALEERLSKLETLLAEAQPSPGRAPAAPAVSYLDVHAFAGHIEQGFHVMPPLRATLRPHLFDLHGDETFRRLKYGHAD